MFNKSARNFNMPFGRAARCTIVEVDEIVPTGSIDPDQVHLPSVYVQRVFKSNAEKPIAVCRLQACHVCDMLMLAFST